MARPIDHLVLAVPDLAAAVGRYRGLGFTVGATNLHPWGTENAIVQLGGAFLELIGLGAGFVPPAPHDDAAPFARPVAAAVARGGGLAMLAFGSADADRDAAAFRAAGLGVGRRLDFGRTAEGPDGVRRPVRFSLAFADDPALPEAGLFACRPHPPETLRSDLARPHPNGALRIDAVMLCAATPQLHRPTLRAIVGAGPEEAAAGDRYPTPTGRLDVLTPAAIAKCTGGVAAPGRFAAFALVVDSLDPLPARLARSGVPHVEIAGALAVPPEAAFGVALVFVPAPCHAMT